MDFAFRSKIFPSLIRFCYVIGGLALVAMMMVVVANIIGRIFFNFPIVGTMEIAGFAGVTVGAIAVSFAERARSNIAACAVLDILPRQIRKILNSFTCFVSFGTVALLFWAVAKAAVVSMNRHEATFALELKVAPFRFIWAAGILLLCWFLILHLIEILGWRGKK